MTTAVKPGPAPDGKGKGKDKGKNKAATVAAAAIMAICALVGIGVLSYPVLATQFNNWEQSRLSRQFGADAQAVDPEVAAQALADAHAYNDTLGGQALQDPWSGGDMTKQPEYKVYEGLLNQFPTMAQMTIPAINVNLPVYHGTSDDTLMKGVGHLFGTALPVGGPGTRAVLTAHSGIRTSTFFDNLDKVRKGDAVYIRNIGETLKYEVRDIEVILPDQIDRIAPVDGEDLITMVTCTPYGINTHRLLVTAVRVPLDDPAEAEAAFDDGGLVWQWWMKLAIGVIAAIIAAIIALGLWLLARRRRASRTPSERET